MYRVNPNALWKEAARVAAAAREARALRALRVLHGVVLEAHGASARRNPALSRRRSDIVGRADGGWICSSRKSRLGEADSHPYDADPLECPVLARSATSAKARLSGARQAATDCEGPFRDLIEGRRVMLRQSGNSQHFYRKVASQRARLVGPSASCMLNQRLTGIVCVDNRVRSPTWRPTFPWIRT
jgi:hypothetical protein